MTRMNEWWAGASRTKRAIIIVVLVLILAAVANAIAQHSKTSGGSSSVFTASCAVATIPVIGGLAAEVDFNNPTSQDVSVVGGQVTVIYFDQNGDQLGTTTVNAPAVISANQSVTTTTGDAEGQAPTGTASCSVAPYQTQP